MILKASQRGGGRQMALHLMNGEQNEHVSVHEVSGFIAQDVLGALNEAYALSKGTKCSKFMYSLSLSPPADESVPVATFEKTLERIEKSIGLEGQPRVVVFHEKEGRRHAHCVWSRIDVEKMKAVNISHDRLKLQSIAKSLYLEHGWKMPEGFRDKNHKNPLNFNRAEWQQAARIGRKPQDIKRELQECWAVSDDRKSFENALQDTGYTLAKGDRRGYVAVDVFGEVYSLTRQLGYKKKALSERLGGVETLPSVDQAKNALSGKLSGLFKRYTNELEAQHQKQRQPLIRAKQDMTRTHRETRTKLDIFQKTRWREEENKRAARIRSGFKGIWDKINGRYWKNRKINENEAWRCHLRDQAQCEELIAAQLAERQALQKQIVTLRDSQEHERKALVRDLSHLKTQDQVRNVPLPENQPEKMQQNRKGIDSPDMDLEL